MQCPELGSPITYLPGTEPLSRVDSAGRKYSPATPAQLAARKEALARPQVMFRTSQFLASGWRRIGGGPIDSRDLSKIPLGQREKISTSRGTRIYKGPRMISYVPGYRPPSDRMPAGEAPLRKGPSMPGRLAPSPRPIGITPKRPRPAPEIVRPRPPLRPSVTGGLPEPRATVPVRTYPAPVLRIAAPPTTPLRKAAVSVAEPVTGVEGDKASGIKTWLPVVAAAFLMLRGS